MTGRPSRFPLRISGLLVIAALRRRPTGTDSSESAERVGVVCEAPGTWEHRFVLFELLRHEHGWVVERRRGGLNYRTALARLLLGSPGLPRRRDGDDPGDIPHQRGPDVT
jgi:hypothetical protein